MLTSTRDVSLNYVNVTDGGDDGIRGLNVTNFTLNRANITGNGNAIEESGADFINLFGTNIISDVLFDNNEFRQLDVDNNTGSLDRLTISDSIFNGEGVASPNGAQGILITMNNAPATAATFQKVVITDTVFQDLRSTGVQMDSGGGTGTQEITVTGSSFNTLGAAGIDVIGAFGTHRAVRHFEQPDLPQPRLARHQHQPPDHVDRPAR